MSSVISLIKGGISSQDWSLIKQALELLTEEDVATELVPQSSFSSVVKKEKKKKVVHAKQDKNNRFYDDGSLCAELILESQKQSEKRSDRTVRPPVELINAKCQKCGAEESVDPFFVRRQLSKTNCLYLCNKCCAVGVR